MSHEVCLVISDVDGTLLNPHKELSQTNIVAVRRLHEAGIQFALVSSRPVRGMKWLIDALEVQAVCAGFNGGLIVNPDLSIVEEYDLPENSASVVKSIIRKHKLNTGI